MTPDKPTPDNEPEADAQVQPIIEAAEQAAIAIVAEAEARAARYVEESRLRTEEIAAQQASDMWGLTDALIDHAEAVKQQSDALLQALNQTRRGVKAALEAAPDPSLIADPSAGGRSDPAAVDPASASDDPQAPEPDPATSPDEPRRASEGARLLATQMVVAGSSREEIAGRLNNEFGIDDADSILESILGPA